MALIPASGFFGNGNFVEGRRHSPQGVSQFFARLRNRPIMGVFGVRAAPDAVGNPKPLGFLPAPSGAAAHIFRQRGLQTGQDRRCLLGGFPQSRQRRIGGGNSGFGQSLNNSPPAEHGFAQKMNIPPGYLFGEGGGDRILQVVGLVHYQAPDRFHSLAHYHQGVVNHRHMGGGHPVAGPLVEIQSAQLRRLIRPFFGSQLPAEDFPFGNRSFDGESAQILPVARGGFRRPTGQQSQDQGRPGFEPAGIQFGGQGFQAQVVVHAFQNHPAERFQPLLQFQQGGHYLVLQKAGVGSHRHRGSGGAGVFNGRDQIGQGFAGTGGGLR